MFKAIQESRGRRVIWALLAPRARLVLLALRAKWELLACKVKWDLPDLLDSRVRLGPQDCRAKRVLLVLLDRRVI